MSSGVAGSYMLGSSKSAYHDSCIPKDRNPVSSSSKKHQEGEYVKCDMVTQDTIWKQSVNAEGRCVKEWWQNWGFITEFDQKGEPKTRQELPDHVEVFSNTVPNTNSGNYGSRLATPLGQQMQKLEFQYYSEKRRRKFGSDLVSY
ncbi:hypothetical protein ScPMuIL_008878 [Solemya velum]